MMVFGAQHDLASLVRTHLFIIAPNNSGSTLLRKAIERSSEVWSLPREGQHALGFPGPRTEGGQALTWNASPDRRQAFIAPGAYDWPTARRAWYFQAQAAQPKAHVFTTSSPPFLLQVDALRAAFPGARFVFLTRHPLAAAEGILRRALFLHPGEDPAEVAAAHLLACLERQEENMARHGDVSLSVRYEDFCAEPGAFAQALQTLCPGLDDVTFDGEVPVKGLYQEPVRNMNADQIARLSATLRARLESLFAAQAGLMSSFGYKTCGSTVESAQQVPDVQ